MVDGEWEGISLIANVMFWFNLSLAEILKDRLKDEEDRKNIASPSFRQINKFMLLVLKDKTMAADLDLVII